MGMKSNLQQTKGPSLVGNRYLGKTRVHRPRASCAHSTCWGHARAPCTCARQERPVPEAWPRRDGGTAPLSLAYEVAFPSQLKAVYSPGALQAAI
ncbi:unnamed protein product, partial [Gulo gulo]